jgi:hypothetical protein
MIRLLPTYALAAGLAAAGLAAAPALATPSAPPSKDSQAALADVGSWLDAELSGLRSEPGAGAGPRAQRAARELRARLEGSLAGEDVTDAVCGALDPGGSGPEFSPWRGLESARRRLYGLSRASLRPSPPLPPNSRRRAEEILHDPVFVEAAKGPGPLQRAVMLIREWVFDLFQSVTDTAERHPRLVLGAIIALLGLCGLWILNRVLRRARGRTDRMQFAAADTASSAEGPGGAPADLLRKADEAAAHGRRREALALIECACVLELRRSGALPLQPGLTDLEGVRWLRRGGAAEPSEFERVVLLHDRIIYGGAEASAEAVGEARRLAEAVLGAASREAA